MHSDGLSPPVAQKRAIDKPETPVFQMFSVTFLPHEEVCLIWRNGNILEIFFPFPSLHDRYSRALNMVLENLQTNWLRIQNPIIRTYSFFSSFYASNLWIPYFACLRLTQNADQVQQIFLDTDRKTELETRALSVYHHIGRNIAQCLIASPTTHELGRNLFSPNSRPVTLNNEQIEFLTWNGLATQKLPVDDVSWFDDVVPIDLKSAAILNAQQSVESRNFIPTNPQAPKARFYFS